MLRPGDQQQMGAVFCQHAEQWLHYSRRRAKNDDFLDRVLVQWLTRRQNEDESFGSMNEPNSLKFGNAD